MELPFRDREIRLDREGVRKSGPTNVCEQDEWIGNQVEAAVDLPAR
jgi:hypothetical protein